MTKLYDVTITVRTAVRKFDRRGKEIGSTPMDRPMTLTKLTHAEAMRHAGTEGFSMKEHVDLRAAKGTGRDSSVGSGVKRMTSRTTSVEMPEPRAANMNHRAAITGDLSAAINV